MGVAIVASGLLHSCDQTALVRFFPSLFVAFLLCLRACVRARRVRVLVFGLASHFVGACSRISASGPRSHKMSRVNPAVSNTSTLEAELGLGKPCTSVDEWLDRLMLPQYKPVFLEHAIQLADLDQLTADMLWQIGIKPLGHRLAMVRGAGLIRAQETFARRNQLLHPVFSDYCDASCFGNRYKITATTLTVTKPGCCSVSIDPVDLSQIRDINYVKGCCSGVVDITTIDPSLPLLQMKLTNRDCEKIANLLIQAKERDEVMGAGGSVPGLRAERQMAGT